MKSSKAFIAESLLIILSVTISFWIEDLRQNRNDKKIETYYLKGILSDLKEDQSEIIRDSIRVNESLREALYLLKFIYSKKGYDKDSVLQANLALSVIPKFIGISSHYTALKSSGQFADIENKELLNKIISYYDHEYAMLQHEIVRYYDYTFSTYYPKWPTSLRGSDYITDEKYKKYVPRYTTDFEELKVSPWLSHSTVYYGFMCTNIQYRFRDLLKVNEKLRAAINQELAL